MAIGWITPVEITPSTASAWVDVDVSSYVPSGTTGVILHVVNNDPGGLAIGLRKNGSTDNRTTVMQTATHFWGTIGVDANRIFEAYVGSTTNQDIFLVGYFMDESSFFTNAVNKSLSSTGSWIDINISSDTGADTAIGALFEINKSGTDYAVGLRKNGSTDNRTSALGTWHRLWAIVGCDSNEILEGYIGDLSVDFFWLVILSQGLFLILMLLICLFLQLMLGWICLFCQVGQLGDLLKLTQAQPIILVYGRMARSKIYTREPDSTLGEWWDVTLHN